MKTSVFLAFTAAALASCTTMRPSSVRWEPVVLWRGEAAFERVRAGRPDASDPTLQLVGVDQAGNVVHVHYDGGEPRAQVIHRHPSELTGLLVADVDASLPGEEIYVGGHDHGDDGGAVVQLSMTPEGVRVRRVWTGSAYVHSIERLDPARLLVCTYAGEIHVLSPTPGDGPWQDRTIFRDAPSSDPDRPRIKDAGLLRDPSGRAPHEALVVFKTGRALWIDVERPEIARFVHDEEGGLSRVTPDDDGGAYVTGYFGRVLHFVRDGAGFRVDPIDHEGKESGLRGCVRGRFPLPSGETAPLALFGFHRLCRALSPRFGAWDATTLFRDVDRGHAIEAADLVPGNDADEIVLSGYSKAITVLVARRE